MDFDLGLDKMCFCQKSPVTVTVILFPATLIHFLATGTIISFLATFILFPASHIPLQAAHLLWLLLISFWPPSYISCYPILVACLKLEFSPWLLPIYCLLLSLFCRYSHFTELQVVFILSMTTVILFYFWPFAYVCTYFLVLFLYAHSKVFICLLSFSFQPLSVSVWLLSFSFRPLSFYFRLLLFSFRLLSFSFRPLSFSVLLILFSFRSFSFFYGYSYFLSGYSYATVVCSCSSFSYTLSLHF